VRRRLAESLLDNVRMSAFEPFSETSLDPPVRGFLHRPESPSGDVLVITHGAGGNSQSSLLQALAAKFAEEGVSVLRCDLPFRQVRRFGPPRPGDAARDRQGLRNAVQAMRKVSSGKVFLGGQSYGGRQASMLLAEEAVADGLLLLSYPLHAPGHPEKPRIEHLPKLQLPTLFVHGTRDPFGTIEEIENARKLIPGKTELLVVDGAHDLGFKGKTKIEAVPGRVLEACKSLFGMHGL
jgi:predicted alpha/beta-hydrolase family hydrolase